MQVRLLQTVSGTGNQNEVVHVAPAYFENVLKKKKLGVKVTDEEVRRKGAEEERGQSKERGSGGRGKRLQHSAQPCI